MGTVISIEYVSAPRLGAHDCSNVPKTELHALIEGCAILLERIDKLAKQVELIKIIPWHGRGGPNLFDVRIILSMHGEGPIKLEAKATFEATNREKGWHPKTLTEKFVREMEKRIQWAVEKRLRELEGMKRNWEQRLPNKKPSN